MTNIPHYYAMPGLKFRHAINKYDNIPFIIETVAKYYGLTTETMKQRGRWLPLVTARQMAMYIIKKNTDLALKKIGKEFGGYDHTTVIHACKFIESQVTARHQNDMKTDFIKLLQIL